MVLELTRAIAWAALAWTAVGFGQATITPVIDLPREASEASLSPDGKTIAFNWCNADFDCGIYTRPLAGGIVRYLAGKDREGATAFAPRWSPDGRRVLYSRGYSRFDFRLFVKELETGKERRIGTGRDSVVEGTWSPEGRFVLARVCQAVWTGGPCQLTLIVAETGERVSRELPAATAAALSPDGSRLAFADGNALMLVPLTPDYSPVGKAEPLTREPGTIWNLHWTADGKQIVYAVQVDATYTRRVIVEQGARPTTLPGRAGGLEISQMLPDGRALATEPVWVRAVWRASIGAAREGTSAKVERVKDPGCAGGVPGCSPDRRLRVYATTSTGFSQIWMSNGDGRNARPFLTAIPTDGLAKGRGFVTWVDWSPDGKWIAFAVMSAENQWDSRMSLFVMPASGGKPRRLGGEAYALGNPTWSGDSKSIYASRTWRYDDREHSQMQPVVRVDVATGTLTETGAAGVWSHLTQDGRYLYSMSSPYPKLWRVPTGGGKPEQLLDRHRLNWHSTAVGRRFLYTVEEPVRGIKENTWTLMRFDPESKQLATVAELGFRPVFAYLSPDEQFLYLGQEEGPRRRVVMVEGCFQDNLQDSPH